MEGHASEQKAWKGFAIFGNAVAACFLLRLTCLTIHSFLFVKWRGISTRKGGLSSAVSILVNIRVTCGRCILSVAGAEQKHGLAPAMWGQQGIVIKPRAYRVTGQF